jgi:RNA polymerase sigma-70 factor (ECF subfamily)
VIGQPKRDRGGDDVNILRRRQSAHSPPEPETASDALLVARARQDLRAFATVYDRYFPTVYGYCLGELGDVTAAEDAASQTFLKALAALPGYRETGRFRGWLFAIAHGVIVDALRARRPQAALEVAAGIIDPGIAPEDAAIAALDLARLDAAIAQLPTDDRRVLELRRAGLSGQEIAAVLGIGYEAAKKRQLRAMDRLQAELLPDPIGREVRRGA